MAPNKFEESIKNKLEKRTIQPSKDAWAKLENRLDPSDKMRKNKTIFWMGLAASIVGILLVASQFFNEAPLEKSTPILVVSPEVNKHNIQTQVAVEKPNIEETINSSEKPTTEIQTTQVVATPAINSKTKQEAFTAVSNEVAIAENNSQEQEVQPAELKLQNLSFEERKIQQVIAQVQILKDHDTAISDADLEALLIQAQNEIMQEKLYRRNSGIVDARSLLQDVEADLDRTFRDKVFEALKANFNFVKTAVAQRND
ncbi:hypothetical protein V8G56_08280 [Gaetbulibacter aquiaggeris]|uniref:Anti-sigma factor n=1 Tax=Gaetbulibacter aquiaggeris TaxID=1735373 RepID=A0ABW7MPH2_9FLAO